ncbi:hypothetical protein PCLA_01r1054 [Pseudomonas citronellolis]|nr:hypothetical protein PCLA_01r1054 [Pseudomonas citronellolis]
MGCAATIGSALGTKQIQVSRKKPDQMRRARHGLRCGGGARHAVAGRSSPLGQGV